MIKTPLKLALAFALIVASATALGAQDPQASAAPKPSATPLKVTVTIARYQGEKRISSLPYTLSVNLVPGESGKATLRMGSKIPIETTASNGLPSTNYQDVGTNIDCVVAPPDESGRFRVNVTVSETDMYVDPAAKGAARPGQPTLKNFQTTDSVMIKDGQSLPLSSTPDKTSGEIVRVDVTLVVVK